MKRIDARVDQWLQKGLQQLRRRGQTRGEILLLPLRPAQNEREIRSHLGATGLDNLHGKATARRH